MTSRRTGRNRQLTPFLLVAILALVVLGPHSAATARAHPTTSNAVQNQGHVTNQTSGSEAQSEDASTMDIDHVCDGASIQANVICPESAEAREFITYVMSTHDGVSIHLTGAGIELGQSCRGAERLVNLASALYSELPADQRSHADLLWANPLISREMYAHAVAADLGIERGNPVDIVFGDYTGASSTAQGVIWRGNLAGLLHQIACET